jgi:hypothetical protein
MHNQISNVMDISKSVIEELKLLIQLKEKKVFVILILVRI